MINKKSNSLSLSLLKEKCKKFITLRVTTHRVEQIKNLKKRSLIILTFSVLISFLFVSLITYGATTIGSNINTQGTLTVSGASNFTGAIWASSTLQTTGAARFYSTARIDGATILNSVSYTWPSSDGSASTYLQTNGAGTLSWATVSGGGAAADWLKQTNFGVLNLTASTTIPYWAKDAIYASSTLQVQGLTTLANATTSLLTVSNGAWFTNGNIGISTTSPWGLLSINPNGISGPSFVVGSSTVTNFVITNSGNVGIGTTSPYAKLSVDGILAANSLNINLETATSTFAGGLAIETSGFVYNWQTNNVGIGTVAPGAKLHTSVAGNNELRIETTAAGDPYITFVQSGTQRIGMGIDDDDSDKFKISYTTGNFNATGLTLDSIGNVGIGTTSPYAKLSVVGEVVATYFTATSTTATSTFLGAVGVGTSTPAEQLSVSGRLFVGGTGTSTIQNNLYVMGTLRSTVSYVGDLIFSNNFKFIETPLNAKIQSLFLQNQNGENIFKINKKGQLVVKEIEAERGKFREGNFEEKLCIKNTCISEKELKELLELKKKN